MKQAPTNANSAKRKARNQDETSRLVVHTIARTNEMNVYMFEVQVTDEKGDCENQGNPKTLTPAVRGSPLRTGSTDYLRTGPGTTPTDHPQNRIKNKNKDTTYCFSNRSLVPAENSSVTLRKINRPGFSSRRRYRWQKGGKSLPSVCGLIGLEKT